MQVSVRDFKEHLSQYLREVLSGREVIVTRHGVPVARVEGIEPRSELTAVERLASAEAVEAWAGGKPRGARVPLRRGIKTAAELVSEDRG